MRKLPCSRQACYGSTLYLSLPVPAWRLFSGTLFCLHSFLSLGIISCFQSSFWADKNAPHAAFLFC